jgi:hypothetical protein
VVILGDHDDVARAELVEKPVEFRPHRLRAGDLLAEDPAGARDLECCVCPSRCWSSVETRA